MNPLMTLKMAVLAPTPNASVSVAVMTNDGDRQRWRMTMATSVKKVMTVVSGEEDLT